MIDTPEGLCYLEAMGPAAARTATTARDGKRYYPTPALEKGLDILELFASTPEGMTISEVARRLNRTMSEIFRMLLCLEQRGYLTQSANKDRYHLTLRLFRLAQEYPPTKRMVTEALPIMHWLAHELRQSCHLGVLDCGHVVILAQVVFPTPRGPQKRKAWASWLCLIAFLNVVVICDCPTTVSKSCGLYFLAETINFSMT